MKEALIVEYKRFSCFDIIKNIYSPVNITVSKYIGCFHYDFYCLGVISFVVKH